MYAHQRSLSRFEQQVSSASFSVAFGSSLERIAREISPKSIFSGIED
jgi:hypothetical protein